MLSVVDVLTAIAVVAAITLMVRPGSRGPELVAALGDAWSHAAAGAAGFVMTGTTDPGHESGTGVIGKDVCPPGLEPKGGYLGVTYCGRPKDDNPCFWIPWPEPANPKPFPTCK